MLHQKMKSQAEFKVSENGCIDAEKTKPWNFANLNVMEISKHYY